MSLNSLKELHSVNSEQNVRQDRPDTQGAPRGGPGGEAALMHPKPSVELHSGQVGPQDFWASCLNRNVARFYSWAKPFRCFCIFNVKSIVADPSAASGITRSEDFVTTTTVDVPYAFSHVPTEIGMLLLEPRFSHYTWFLLNSNLFTHVRSVYRW